jgi:hypothetical protein
MEAVCSSEMSADFHWTIWFINQKIQLFTATTVRTSNPTYPGFTWKDGVKTTKKISVRIFSAPVRV